MHRSASHGSRPPRSVEDRPQTGRCCALVFCCACLVCGNCGGEEGAGGAVPPTPVFTAPVDPLARYEGQTSCDPTPKPGVEAFRDLVLATYPDTRDLGIVRGCDVGGASEHKEGRAWDWGVDAGDPQADALLGWLLATDEGGTRWAMARRLGVMYVIFDSLTWKAYRAEDGWQLHGGASPHTDHVHFSFSWDGALGRTSFYSAR